LHGSGLWVFVVVLFAGLVVCSVWHRSSICVAGPQGRGRTFAVLWAMAVCHRSHFGSRYKLGCCGHAGLLRFASEA